MSDPTEVKIHAVIGDVINAALVTDKDFNRALQLARFRLECASVVVAHGSVRQKEQFAKTADDVYNWCLKGNTDTRPKG